MKKEALKFLVLLLVAIGAGPATGAIWQWSTTAGSNGTADPSINFSEGMAPSAVNDSARAMMAALAAWRNDISAVNATAGTSTAYTLTTSEGVNTTPANGQMLSFIAHATNGISPTLTVDGGNTYPIWFNGAVTGAGTLVSGTPYRVAFNTANSAWLLEAGYGNPYSIALGAFMESTIATPPNSNFILPAGQCISTTTYAVYWTAIGSPASGACPGGQFAVIDMRGRTRVALDNLNGTPANRMTSAVTGCGTAMTSVGAVCANSTEGIALTLAQLPTGITSSNATQSITVGGNSAINFPFSSLNWAGTDVSTTGGSTGIVFSAGSRGSTTTITGSNAISVTSNNTNGTAVPRVTHTIATTLFLRVL